MQAVLAGQGTDEPKAGGDATCRLDARVLLVEDHPVNQEVAAQMLRTLSCDVETVGDGRAALAALEAGSHDIVLMDCNMPVMDGFQATAELRRREQATGAVRVPIIALTANALQGDRQRCLEAGMDDYLSKPFTAVALGEMLERWLGGPAADATGAPKPGPAESTQAPNGVGAPRQPTTAAAETGTEPPLDPSVLDAIRAMDADGSAAFLQTLVAKYLASSEGDLARLDASAANGDAETLGKTAHRLKSASANLGAMGLSAMCRELEMAGRTGQIDDAEAQVAAVRAEYLRVSDALQHESKVAA
jgi:CheY-like chemotaxis protein